MSREKGLDLYWNTKDKRRPSNTQYVTERNEPVNVLEVTLEQLTANANDLILPASRLRPDLFISYMITGDANRNITGFANQWPGRKVVAINRGSFNIVLQHQNAGSLAQHRIISPTAADYTLGPFESAILCYISPDRWVIVAGTGA